MKVFEVLYERYEDDGRIVDVREYVTGASLKIVADFYTRQCEELEDGMKSVREVLTIVRHISILGGSDYD